MVVPVRWANATAHSPCFLLTNPRGSRPKPRKSSRSHIPAGKESTREKRRAYSPLRSQEHLGATGMLPHWCETPVDMLIFLINAGPSSEFPSVLPGPCRCTVNSSSAPHFASMHANTHIQVIINTRHFPSVEILCKGDNPSDFECLTISNKISVWQ